MAGALRAGTNLAASGLLLFVTHTAASAEPTPLEEVLVTSRRVTESIAAIPMAIDVIDGERLAPGAFDGLRSLAATTPGLYYESMWGGMNSAIVLRGQSQPSAAGDNVGVFVDGVYQAARHALDVDILDVERIEVVRGPQSSLFGHSTFAGAVHYVTAQPSSYPVAGISLGAGSDDYRFAGGYVSGPLAGGRLQARFAAGASAFDGTGQNAAGERQALGGTERRAASLTLSTSEVFDWQLRLSARAMHGEFSHPMASVVTYEDYNCGSQDAASGAWSYYCGRLPVGGSFDLSLQVPDSVQDTGQVAVNLRIPLNELTLEADLSHYRSHAHLYRDFDGSSAGDLFGVCTLLVNCASPLGVPLAVNRLIRVNEVQLQSPEIDETSLDIRIRNREGGVLAWMAGLTGYQTDERVPSSIGADGSGLLPEERLAAYLPGTPPLVGPASAFNRALVPDPNRTQVPQSFTLTQRRTVAVYGSADWAMMDRLHARAELRATLERTSLDSRLANFQPSFGKAIQPSEFTDVTPRLSLDYRLESSLLYVSAAKGSRSGGINRIPGLLPEEQSYEPEENWTYELGGRLASVDRAIDASGTLFYIDWSNVQITGFSNTPGIGNLITRNARGITTRGAELALGTSFAGGWRADAGVSWVDARFRAGSDDPGSSRFCGLSATSSTSTFCVVGPARTAGGNGMLVPYVDGNRLQRAPVTSWHAALSYAGRVADELQLSARIDVGGQDDVYDRAIGGARYGARVLCDARIALKRGGMSVELWGLNLGDDRYLAAVASRGAVFFPTTPRPLDLLHGPGRRFGVTLRYER